MTTKHDKLNKTQRKAGLTPDEIDAFFDSDAYITINADPTNPTNPGTGQGNVMD